MFDYLIYLAFERKIIKIIYQSQFDITISEDYHTMLTFVKKFLERRAT